jgi:hypothetical protein
MKQLERLLFLQGNVCFFCQQPIPTGEASIEHLVATSNGGAKDDENCVACCKTVNAALGNLSVKAKLQVIVNQRGAFACPREATSEEKSTTATSLLQDQLNQIVVDLQKRGSARPRRTATLRNTINSVFQNKLSESELSSLLATLQSRGYISVQDAKVTYALPQAGV